jgi:autotransporter-associated beta strand protein
MTKKSMFVGVSALAMTVANAASAQNLVTNGSFEGTNGLAGWTIGGTAGDGLVPVAIQYNQASEYPTGAQGEAVPTDNAASASPDPAGQKGVYFVSDQANNLSVYQNVYLTPGSYQIGFDTYDTYNGAVQPNDATLTADIAGVQLANYNLSSVAAGIWTTHSGTALITTAGYYPVAFIFNTTVFPAKDVVIDRAYVIGVASGGTQVDPVVRLYWDGDTAGNANNGKVDGGVGTWTTTSPNFTDQTGVSDGAFYPQPGSVIFEGSPGVVTVDSSAGQVSVTGMQFAVNGYNVVGGSIALSGANATIQVGDGTAAGVGYVATVASALTGSSGLIKTDLGTLVLSGQNSYTGATTINAGTLAGGAANTFSITSPVTVNAGGTLDLGGYVQAINAVTLNGGAITSSATCNGCYVVPYGELNNTAITSTGGSIAAGLVGSTSLTIQSGVTTLSRSAVSLAVGSDDTSYTGATTISGGTLKGGSVYAFSPATDVTVASGAIFDLGGYSQIIGSLSGAGTVTSTGNGSSYAVTLDLYDTNSPNFSGTTFSGQIADGDSPVALTLGPYSQPFTLTLTGANNTFSGGVTWGQGQTISIDNANAIGVGTLHMYPGSTLQLTSGFTLANNIVFEQYGDPTIDTGANAVTLTGVISDDQGPGSLDKVGSGTLTLTNVETYTGGTEIHAGTLEIGTSANPGAQLAAGLVTVDSGATLGGYGTIGGSVTNNGTLDNNNNFAPLGLTIKGSYTQGSGGNLIIGVTPSAATLLKVGGAATLGGTVTFAYAPGTYHAAVLKFLDAAGGVTGTFSTVAASTAVPTGVGIGVAYKADEADLVLTSPTATTVSPNDAKIFSAQSFSFAEANEDAATNLLGRTRPDGGGNTFYNLTPAGGPEVRAWMDGVGSFIDTSSRAGLPGLRATAGGTEAGADVALADLARLGIALGYGRNSFTDSEAGSASQDVFRVSLYGSETVGPVGLSAVLSYAHARDHTDRATGFGAAGSSRGTDAFTGAVQASAPFDFDNILITPSVGAMVSSLSAGRFVETGNSAFALAGAASSVTSVSPFAVVGLSRTLITESGITITPDAEIGYRYDGASQGGRVTLTAADGTSFADNQYGVNRSGALLGASVTVHRDQLTAFAKYSATVSSGWTDQRVEAGIRFAF